MDAAATERWSIGELARRTGLPTRTIRFWSDEGLVPPSGRTPSGYRTFGAADAVRLGLVRTLRELGLDLPTVRRVLEREASVAEVAAVHADAIDAQIRVLRVQRAVLRAAAAARPTLEEMELMNRLARLSADQRNQIITDLVDEAFAGLPDDNGIAERMRTALPDLPDDPSPEQVNAWVELAELVAEPSFRTRLREMAERGAEGAATEAPPRYEQGTAAVVEKGSAAVAGGLTPTAPEAAPVLDRILTAFAADGAPTASASWRSGLGEQLATFTDERVERYWQLLGVIKGWPTWPPMAPAYRWVVDALAAR
ncbi:MAG: MerR family transcriptional regulator [Acidimicrobiia bacterium]|nr:MerR family transcriptional regulator [Acidimicrobiia bacterium]